MGHCDHLETVGDEMRWGIGDVDLLFLDEIGELGLDERVGEGEIHDFYH